MDTPNVTSVRLVGGVACVGGVFRCLCRQRRTKLVESVKLSMPPIPSRCLIATSCVIAKNRPRRLIFRVPPVAGRNSCAKRVKCVLQLTLCGIRCKREGRFHSCMKPVFSWPISDAMMIGRKLWFLVPLLNSNQASQSQFETKADQECSKLRIWKSSRAVLAMIKRMPVRCVSF
jgi:hypothetical protein